MTGRLTEAWWLIILAVLLLFAGTLFVLKIRRTAWAVAILVLCGFISWTIYGQAWLRKGTLTVIRECPANGLDFAVVQIHGGFGIYDTSFFVRPSNTWLWFYLDHDSPRWNDVSIEVEALQEKRIVVKRNKKAVGYCWSDSGKFSNALNGITYSDPVGRLQGDIKSNWYARQYIVR